MTKNKHRGIVYYRAWQVALPIGFGVSLGVQLTTFLLQKYGACAIATVLFLSYAVWADWKLHDLDRQLNRDEARIRKRRRKEG